MRESFNFALERFKARLEGNVEAETRPWKLFGLIPIMLLHKLYGTGSVGRSVLGHRVDDFARGLWTDLIQSARDTVPRPRPIPPVSMVQEQERRGRAAQNRVQQGQVSKARQELIGAALAPRDESTLDELTRRRPQERRQQIPVEVLDFVPDGELRLDTKQFAECLRSAPSGSSPGPGGCSNEILKVCLDDRETLLLLTKAAEDFARATVPGEVFRAFMSATMTALEKRGGGVRGIATGTVFRRLVAKTFARQFGKEVEAACSPFQFALSTRAGVDCVGHVVRSTTDADPTATVLSVDGIGAFDLISRSKTSDTNGKSFATKLCAPSHTQSKPCLHTRVTVTRY